MNITASDDGVNSSGGSDTGSEARVGRDSFMQGDPDCDLTFSGGIVKVNADGDGIDSNGNIYVTGGEVYVSGPTNGGNGAIDYGDQGCVCEVTGGIVAAAGAVGMEIGFGEGSEQYSVLHNFSSQVSGEFTVTDGSGSVVLSFTPEKEYRSVVFSCPELTDGNYTLSAGGITEEVEVSSVVTSNSSGMGGGFGGDFKGGGNGGKMRGGKMPDGDMRGGTPPEMPNGEIPEGEPPEMPV